MIALATGLGESEVVDAVELAAFVVLTLFATDDTRDATSMPLARVVLEPTAVGFGARVVGAGAGPATATGLSFTTGLPSPWPVGSVHCGRTHGLFGSLTVIVICNIVCKGCIRLLFAFTAPDIGTEEPVGRHI
jgi:hypothetical protein